MSDPITRLNAALEGRYRVERQLGEGGMATVYLARDEKHNRNVALKVLKPELAAVVGAERFLAEIETTANLQHPHVLGLYDSGEADGMLFYVMPWVEGESLRNRLDREHQLPVDDAIRIAANVAEALDYAHRHGVIHRDIKPANVLLVDGKPVISDFGIALAVSSGGRSRLTETGLSMGTPHYMSPEQATGDQNVGPATDIYALGCVLYEMLVGEPPFTGSTPQAVLGKIITGEVPSAKAERTSVPLNVDAAIVTALQKVPADRFVEARDFGRALADGGFRHGQAWVSTGDARPVARTWRWAALALGSVAGLLMVVQLLGTDREYDPRSVVRLEFSVPGGVTLAGRALDISPDGSRIVYVGMSGDGEDQLWERRITGLFDLEPRPIPGTVGRRAPVVSPDGVSLISESREQLTIGSLQGGPLTQLVVGGRDPTFAPDGKLYYASAPPGSDPRGFGVIHRLPLDGGEPEEFVRLEGDLGLRYLEALPNGGLLMTIVRTSDPQQSAIAVSGPNGGEVRELFPGAMARYAKSGHIVFATAEGTLMAALFDDRSLQLEGAPVAILEGVAVGPMSGSLFDLSETGTLAYVSRDNDEVRPVWVDREGNSRTIDPEFRLTGRFSQLALSPDGSRLAYSSYLDGVVDLWVKGLDRGPSSRLTRGEGTQSFRPSWSSAESVTYISNRAGQRDVWTSRADGGGTATLSLDLDQNIHEAVFSPSREWLIYRLADDRGAVGSGTAGIFAARFGRDTMQVAIAAATGATEAQPALSPNGRWLAYRSDETGRNEVYVVPFPEGVAMGRVQISTEGGVGPVWAPDGRELFYRSGNNELVAANVAENGLLEVTGRTGLFSMERFLGSASTQVYDASPDGGEFVMLERETSGRQSVVVVLNFHEELKRLVPN